MAGGLRTRRAQIAMKTETTEGTAEALTAAEAFLVYNPTFTPNIDEVVRTPARATFSQLASLAGKRACGSSFGMEVKGSGAVATPPDWDIPIKACGYQRLALSKVPIGAITTGPFVPGELVTFVGSGATGRVAFRHATGVTHLYVFSVTGVPANLDVATGGTSLATATLSAGATASVGFVYLPISTGEISVTSGFYLDGIKGVQAGARGDFSIGGPNGNLGMFDFNYAGKYGGITDVAMLSGITYEDEIPPVFLNVSLYLHSSYQPIFSTMGFAQNNALVPREHAGDSTGFHSTRLGGRAPTISLDPEMCLVADHDWFGKVLSGARGLFHAEWGSGTGSRVVLSAPFCQYTGPSLNDASGVARVPITLRLSGDTVNTADDEVMICVY